MSLEDLEISQDGNLKNKDTKGRPGQVPTLRSASLVSDTVPNTRLQHCKLLSDLPCNAHTAANVSRYKSESSFRL